MYLDDGLGYGSKYEEAKSASDSIRADLIASGFVPNVQKSKWEPSKTLEWLGYDIDLDAGSVSVPERRIIDINQSVFRNSSE